MNQTYDPRDMARARQRIADLTSRAAASEQENRFIQARDLRVSAMITATLYEVEVPA